jgi:hypothetical protein
MTSFGATTPITSRALNTAFLQLEAQMGGASVTVSDTPPTTPAPEAGDQWFESDTGRQLVYYDGVWVEIGSTATTNVNASDLSGTTLASNVVSSSLTSVGTLGSLAVTGDITRGGSSLPRGIVARATSTTSYTLTTSEVIATGMTVTFTAVASRYYKITYFEPQAQTASFASNTSLTLRQTNASGTVLQNTVFQNESNATDQSGMVCIKTSTFSAGSITVVGTAKCNQTTGAPQLIRDATREAFIVVEDIGII